jgi:hypothetical protein
MRVVSIVLLASAALAAAGPAAAEPNVRLSPGASSGSFFGNSIGVDFRGGTLVAAWPDNSAGLAGNPDAPELDVAFAGLGGPVVNVTRKPLSQSGVSLAVDPTNPDRLVVAALDADGSSVPRSLRAFSRDGGATWTVVDGLPGNFGSFPPQVAFDAFGNAFLALVHDPTFGNPRVELHLSTDGGATFSPLPLPTPQGLETNVAVAAGFGSVWLAFQGYDGTVRVRTLAAPVSGLGQVGAFTGETLPGSQDGRTPDVAIGAAGQALVVYHQGQFSSAPKVTAQLDADGPGGAGFGATVTVANVPGYPHEPRPRVAYDAGSGRAYAVYEERLEPTGPEDVLLSFSDDDGAGWSAEIRISDAVHSQDRNLPNVAVAGSGAVGVAWIDFRSGGGEAWADVRASVAEPPEPRAPLDLSATAVSRSQIDLRWTDASGNETGFQVERRTENPFQQPVIVATLPAGATSYSDTNLPEDTPFGYRVRAVNAAGASFWSNGAGATTLASPPPAPQNLVATAVTFQRIDLSWQASANADFYEVERSTDGVDFVLVSRPGGTSAMFFGLQPETTYFWRVRAVNSGGPSPYSNVASATTLAENQPSAPTELFAFAISPSRIDLGWRDNSVNETKFEVERSTSGGPFKRVANVRADLQRYSDTGLKRSTSYAYRIRACNSSFCSPYSNTATATTPSR